MRRLAMLTPESAAEFNGVPAVGDEMTFIGLGALGSQLFMNLWRSGFGRWTLIDRDLHLPHNDSRHALVKSIGEFKASAMANVAAAIFPEHKPVYIVADVLTPGAQAIATSGRPNGLYPKAGQLFLEIVSEGVSAAIRESWERRRVPTRTGYESAARFRVGYSHA